MMQDNNGAIRHMMPGGALLELYKDLENFVADLTTEEYERHMAAIKEVQTIIHKRIRETKE